MEDLCWSLITEIMLSPQEFYQHPSVQQRIAQYCGGQTIDPESFTAEYLSGIGETFKLDRVTEEYFFSPSHNSFFWLLDKGADVFRSVWDRNSTLGVLDIEYFNLLYPAEAYFNPVRTFHMLESVCRQIEEVFERFGIETIRIMTGQGYHYSFRVSFADPVHAQLVSLGRVGRSLERKYSSPESRLTRQVPKTVGLAFDGIGRLLEYVSHLMLRNLGPRYKGIRTVCTDLSVGGPLREAVSLDLSMYADPIYMRDIRCPFSTYQKHKYLQGKFGARAAEEIPIFVTFPRPGNFPVNKLLEMRSDFIRSQEFAGETDTAIPDASRGVRKLIRSYLSSKLYKFHRSFDAAEHDDPERWPETYDRLDLRTLPACVAHGLMYPNDNLLKPTNLQALTRVLMKMGWHPKHIAGLVRSKFERDFGWGKLWFKYDAAARADFYVRLFAGLLHTGLDKEEDLNCRAHAEKGYCWDPGCGCDLSDYTITGQS